jgi:hypothetical protein
MPCAESVTVSMRIVVNEPVRRSCCAEVMAHLPKYAAVCFESQWLTGFSAQNARTLSYKLTVRQIIRNNSSHKVC